MDCIDFVGHQICHPKASAGLQDAIDTPEGRFPILLTPEMVEHRSGQDDIVARRLKLNRLEVPNKDANRDPFPTVRKVKL